MTSASDSTNEPANELFSEQFNPPVSKPTPWARRLMVVTWPAFLSACVLELLVFSMVDPLDLHLAGDAIGWTRQGVYTASFFVFWMVCMGSNALTAILAEKA